MSHLEKSPREVGILMRNCGASDMQIIKVSHLFIWRISLIATLRAKSEKYLGQDYYLFFSKFMCTSSREYYYHYFLRLKKNCKGFGEHLLKSEKQLKTENRRSLFDF